MKRSMIILLAAILVLAMAFTLTGCGSNGDTKDSTDTGSITTFTYKGVSVALDGSADEAVAALGEPVSVKSELSCHADSGDDKTYTYNGFIVKTYPKDGVDHVLQVTVTDAGIPTSKGIEVGSSLADVTAAYGEEYNKVAKYYVYDEGEGKTLRFAVEDDKVIQIEYYFNV